jgi:hypothetical protein
MIHAAQETGTVVFVTTQSSLMRLEKRKKKDVCSAAKVGLTALRNALGRGLSIRHQH